MKETRPVLRPELPRRLAMKQAALAVGGAAVASTGLSSLAIAAEAAAANTGGPAQEIWCYYPWWMRDTWRTYDLAPFERLSFFEIPLLRDGALGQRRGWPQSWQGLIDASKASWTKVDVTISFLESVSAFEAIFTKPENVQRAVAEILALAKVADGIHLDFEVFDGVSPAALAGVRKLCTEVSRGLQVFSETKALSVFATVGSVTDLYDKATLALFDRVVIQGYDFHHAKSGVAGPVAPIAGPYELTWEVALQRYLSLGVPKNKLLFAVPLYGYEWPTSGPTVNSKTRGPGKTITYGPVNASLLPAVRTDALSQANRHGALRDPVSGSPYYAYRDADGWHQGWYDDETSIQKKLAFVKQQGLGGIALFALGYDNASLTQLWKTAAKGS